RAFHVTGVQTCALPISSYGLAPARAALVERCGAARSIAASGARAPLDSVKVEAPVGEVAHGAFGSRPAEVGQVDVADRQGLDVFAGLGGYAVAGEREVTWSQNARLGVLDVHVGDVGQVAGL